ncbi:MAG: hypothetical protein ACK4RK_19210 [Gemmataceae bacterium]
MTPHRQHVRRHARRALLWGVTGFVIAQLSMALLMDYAWPQLRDPYYAFKVDKLRQRQRDVARGPRGKTATPPTVVMLGSSRAAMGLQALRLEEQLRHELGQPVVVFNFGTPATGPILEYLYLRRLLRDGIRPSLLLVEVLVPQFATTGLGPVESVLLPTNRLWWHELEQLERLGWSMSERRREWPMTWVVPSYCQRFALVSWLAPTWLSWRQRQDWGRGGDACGWVPMAGQQRTAESARRALERAEQEYATALRYFALDPVAANATRALLSLCQQEDIPVALVWMPEGAPFRSWYSASCRRQMQAFLSQMQAEYPVTLIDAQCWQADDDFHDAHHLLRDGAARFTERLGREYVLPLLANDPKLGARWTQAPRAPLQ